MSELSQHLINRSNHQCELCGSTDHLSTYIVSPKKGQDVSEQVAVCQVCLDQIEETAPIDANHWRCLNDSMWNPEPSVQVLSYRMLHRLSATEGWAQEARDMMYMEDSTKSWAIIGIEEDENKIVHKDANGNILQNGDTVTLIKDLNVKGGGFTAKRGTAVRRINLVQDNAGQIEGNVEGQRIVILTEFVKKN